MSVALNKKSAQKQKTKFKNNDFSQVVVLFLPLLYLKFQAQFKACYAAPTFCPKARGCNAAVIMQVQYIVGIGIAGVLINIEYGWHIARLAIVIIDRPSLAVDEALEHGPAAFSTSLQNLAGWRLLPNLAAADIPKTKSGRRLAKAFAILSTTQSV